MKFKREVDGLYRVALPVEICRELGISKGTILEITVEGAKIILDKGEIKICEHCGSRH